MDMRIFERITGVVNRLFHVPSFPQSLLVNSMTLHPTSLCIITPRPCLFQYLFTNHGFNTSLFSAGSASLCLSPSEWALQYNDICMSVGAVRGGVHLDEADDRLCHGSVND